MSSRVTKYLVTGLVVGCTLALGWLFYQEFMQVQALDRDQVQFQKRVAELSQDDRPGGSWDPDDLPGSSPEDSEFPDDLPQGIVDQLTDHRASSSNLPDRVPDRDLQSLSGDTVNLRRKTGPLIVLNFWATWCAICQTEAPTLRSLNDDFADRPLRVIGVNIQQERPLVREYADYRGLDYPILLDRQGKLANEFYVTGVPETFVIAPDGTVLARFLSYRDWNDESLRHLLSDLMDHYAADSTE